MVVGRYGAIRHSLDADDALMVVGLMMVGMVCGVWLWLDPWSSAAR